MIKGCDATLCYRFCTLKGILGMLTLGGSFLKTACAENLGFNLDDDSFHFPLSLSPLLPPSLLPNQFVFLQNPNRRPNSPSLRSSLISTCYHSEGDEELGDFRTTTIFPSLISTTTTNRPIT